MLRHRPSTYEWRMMRDRHDRTSYMRVVHRAPLPSAYTVYIWTWRDVTNTWLGGRRRHRSLRSSAINFYRQWREWEIIIGAGTSVFEHEAMDEQAYVWTGRTGFRGAPDDTLHNVWDPIARVPRDRPPLSSSLRRSCLSPGQQCIRRLHALGLVPR